MRVLEKIDIQQKKSLVWALLYDVRFLRAGKITSSYFKILETLLNIGIIENRENFLNSDDLIINCSLRASGNKYKTTSSYKSEIYTENWNILNSNVLFNPNIGLLEWLEKVNQIAFKLACDSCWTLTNITINDVVVYEEAEQW
mgnify:FL=1